MGTRAVTALLFAALAACGPTGSSPAEPSSPSNPTTSPLATAPPGGDTVTRGEADAPPRRVIHTDLGRTFGSAELRREGDLVAALDGIAGARATLGGWGTNTHPLRSGDLAGVAGSGRDTRLVLPRSGAGSKLTLRVRSARPGKLSVVVDGEVLEETIEVPAEATTVTFDLGENATGDGDMALSVRAPTSASVDGKRFGVLVGALRLGRGTALETLPHRDDEGSLHLPAGTSVAWTLASPAGGQLAVGIRSGRLRLRILRDGSPAVQTPASTDAIHHELPAGEVVKLELVAEGDTVLSGAAVTVPAPAPRALTKPTHLLVVLVDTLRADKLGPYDADTRVRTPGLDAFVQDATTFARAHSQENWTKPSVATLLSGLMPWEHTATQHESVVPSAIELLPETLGEHGFETASFIANGYVSDRFGFDQGWDSYRNYIREGRRTHAEYVAGDVLAWLDRRNEDKPFFLYVHTIDPHVPYRPPDEDLALYGDPSYRGVIDFSRDATLLENVKRGRIRLGERDRAHLEALYDGEITYHDRHFRSILDGLERRGLTDSTMVVVTSDHGEELFDHGSVGHGHSVYEELLHVPLFVKLPGESPRRVDRSVGLVDVLPTILEAFEIPVPEELAGRSFLGELRAVSLGPDRGTVSAFMDHWRTLNVGRWKLVERPGRGAALYDLDADPQEANDMAESHPLTRVWLRGLLGERLAESAPTPERRRRAPPPQRTVIDDETAAQLRALGYTGD